jgi:hypothetical protein
VRHTENKTERFRLIALWCSLADSPTSACCRPAWTDAPTIAASNSDGDTPCAEATGRSVTVAPAASAVVATRIATCSV